MNNQELQAKNLEHFSKQNLSVINGPRGCGKTTSLLRAASSKDGIYVCLDRHKVDYAKRLCKHFEIREPKIMTYKQLEEGYHLGGLVKPLYCDDIMYYFGSRVGSYPINMISLL